MGFSPWGCKGSDTTEMTYHNRFKIHDKEDDAGIVNNTFHVLSSLQSSLNSFSPPITTWEMS